jgi:ABC transporter with metal-binding/Fe-S-binding domain ATP-binding protein
MRVAALFSGGKDSLYAVYISLQYGWEVTRLITLIPEKIDSWMFHALNIHLTQHLAEATSIHYTSKTTRGEKENELQDLKSILKNLDVEGVVSGAIASEYQRTRIEKICYELGIKSFTPLWHKDQGLILKDQLQAGFEILIVGVFARGLDKSWLGRTIDRRCIKELMELKNKYHINLAGEGGEFETLVIDSPLYEKKLVVDEVSPVWKRDRGYLVIKKAHLEEK